MHPLYPKSPGIPNGSVVAGTPPRRILETVFSFHGRRGRGPWWLFTIGLYLAPYVLLIVLGLLFEVLGSIMWTAGSDGSRQPPDFGNGRESFLVVLLLMVMIAILVASLANNVKRLHDLNRSGWLLLVGVVPLMIMIPGWFRLYSLAALANILLLLWIAFFPGTDGTNRYGEKP